MANAEIHTQMPATRGLPACDLIQCRTLRMPLNDFLRRQDAKRMVDENHWNELQKLAVESKNIFWAEWAQSFFRFCGSR